MNFAFFRMKSYSGQSCPPFCMMVDDTSSKHPIGRSKIPNLIGRSRNEFILSVMVCGCLRANSSPHILERSKKYTTTTSEMNIQHTPSDFVNRNGSTGFGFPNMAPVQDPGDALCACPGWAGLLQEVAIHGELMSRPSIISNQIPQPKTVPGICYHWN